MNTNWINTNRDEVINEANEAIALSQEFVEEHDKKVKCIDDFLTL